MEFFTFLWLFSLTVVLPIIIVRMQTDLKRQRLQARQGDAVQDALTVGELKRLIGEAVDDATAPLQDRIDALERLLPPADDGYGLSEGEPRSREKSVGRLPS